MRMNKYCDEYNLPHPVFVEQTGYFGIVFKNPDYYTKAPEIKVELNDRQKIAAEYLAEHRTIKREEYANICACSAVTAKRDIASLLSKGVIKRIGKTGRGVYYELIN